LRLAKTFIPLAKPRWVEPLAERPERNEKKRISRLEKKGESDENS
jgi:hypothetical protein